MVRDPYHSSKCPREADAKWDPSAPEQTATARNGQERGERPESRTVLSGLGPSLDGANRRREEIPHGDAEAYERGRVRHCSLGTGKPLWLMLRVLSGNECLLPEKSLLGAVSRYQPPFLRDK